MQQCGQPGFCTHCTSWQEYDGGKGQGNREEEEDEEEESNPTAFSTGPLPWSAPPNSPSRTVRMKTVRMSSSRG
eukprot:1160401-Pelagomonas_calceolata.AAC.5